MACENKKISELTAVTQLNDSDLIFIARSGDNYNVTKQVLEQELNVDFDSTTLSQSGSVDIHAANITIGSVPDAAISYSSVSQYASNLNWGNLGINKTDISLRDTIIWERKSSNFTAESNKGYKCFNNISISLPSNPVDNDQIFFTKINDMNDITINGNGKNIIGDTQLIWDTFSPFVLLFDSSSNNWLVTS